MGNSIYYDPNRLLSYNRLLNFVIGERGVGKTYGFKRHAINRWIKHGEQFIYLRRYKSDIKGIDTFFDAVAKEFPDHEFKVQGWDLYVDGERCGWVMPLSSWQSIKAREFPNVTLIVFDEFLLERSSKQHYMQEEPRALLNFIDTVVRNRSNIRVVCLANAVTIVNPYFIYFNVVPNVDKRFNAYEQVLVEITSSPDFKEVRQQTPFGKLIAETEYGRFALGNEFVNDSQVFIEDRSKDSKFWFSIVYEGMILGVWVDKSEGVMFISQDHDPDTKKKFAMTTDDLNENSYLFANWKQNYYLVKMVNAFKNGYLRFDSQVTRNISYELFRNMNVK